MRNSIAGFTITELMVGLLVGSMIIGFCYTAYGFSIRMYSQWDRKQEIVQSVQRIYQTIAFDLGRGKAVLIFNDSLKITLIGNTNLVYRFEDGSLTRNEVQMNAVGLFVAVDIKELDQILNISLSAKSEKYSHSVSGWVSTLNSSKAKFSKGL